MDAPKVYNGNVTVNVSNFSTFEHATVKGNLVLQGTHLDSATFKNIKVEGNLIITDLETTSYEFDGIEVTGETVKL